MQAPALVSSSPVRRPPLQREESGDAHTAPCGCVPLSPSALWRPPRPNPPLAPHPLALPTSIPTSAYRASPPAASPTWRTPPPSTTAPPSRWPHQPLGRGTNVRTPFPPPAAHAARQRSRPRHRHHRRCRRSHRAVCLTACCARRHPRGGSRSSATRRGVAVRVGFVPRRGGGPVGRRRRRRSCCRRPHR